MLEGFGLVNEVRKGFLQKGKQGQNLLLCRGHSMEAEISQEPQVSTGDCMQVGEANGPWCRMR